MITLYSGTPGSGKSLHASKRIRQALAARKMTVISNTPINTDLVSRKGKRKIGEFIYKTNAELTVDYLKNYAKEHHKVGKEGQTLIVIDEAGIMFNSRDFGAFDRKAWLNFLMTHRHFGYNIMLICQLDRMIDRQIRGLVEYHVIHRKVSNFGTIGLMLKLMRIPLFVAVTQWYGIREKLSADFFFYRKKWGRMYDTMMLFGGDQHGTTIAGEAPAGHGDTGSAGGDPCPAGAAE
jgi:zona occludens toxin (predicted ATPase)